MTKGREESDDRKGQEGRGKAAITQGESFGGGKAVTASKGSRQLELISETADSPKGADGGRDRGRLPSRPRAVPKSESTKRRGLPAMTMEEIAREENLMEAFEKVASNDGAPGPDRQTIDEVRKHLGAILPALSHGLLEGTYQPG